MPAVILFFLLIPSYGAVTLFVYASLVQLYQHHPTGLCHRTLLNVAQCGQDPSVPAAVAARSPLTPPRVGAGLVLSL